MDCKSTTIRALAVPSAIWLAFGCGLAVQTLDPLIVLFFIAILPLSMLWGVSWIGCTVFGSPQSVRPSPTKTGVQSPSGASRATGMDPAPPSELADDTMPLPVPGPWRRYAARSLDLLLWGAAMGYWVGLVNAATGAHLMHFGLTRLVETTVAGFIYLPLALFIDAAVCGACGNSVGKALLGVRVTELGGTRPSFARYLRRNFSIWARGLAFGLPIARQLTMIVSYVVLKRERATVWDDRLKFRVVRQGCTVGHYGVAAIIVVALLAIDTCPYIAHRGPHPMFPLRKGTWGRNHVAQAPATVRPTALSGETARRRAGPSDRGSPFDVSAT